MRVEKRVGLWWSGKAPPCPLLGSFEGALREGFGFPLPGMNALAEEGQCLALLKGGASRPDQRCLGGGA
jgi:hypothetical protein